MLVSSRISDEPSYFRLRDRVRGAFVLFVALVVSFGMTLWAKEQIRPRGPHGASIRRTKGIVGYPFRIDGLKSFEAAQALSHGRPFRGMVLDAVSSDGTLNVMVGKNQVKYVFQSSPVKNTKSRGPAKPTTPSLVCPRQVVKLKREGMVAEGDRVDAACPTDLPAPLPRPRCGTKEVWAKAIAKGAPKNATARLDYFRSKVGPAWKFQIPSTRFLMNLTDDCKRELPLDDAIGKVP